jgi:hypothetical protein
MSAADNLVGEAKNVEIPRLLTRSEPRDTVRPLQFN